MEWISVEEQLPEVGQMCAVITPGFSVPVCGRYAGKKYKTPAFKIGQYDFNIEDWRVTHWVLLPSLPLNDR